MRKIYVSHSASFNFKDELYKPLRQLFQTRKIEVIFPHETEKYMNTKEVIRNSSLIIAEVSYPSTGQGIELGWADSFGKKITCFYKRGTSPSRSIRVISQDIFQYENPEDLVNQVNNILIV